ncbi:MAG TPA: sigma-70 family RNA polymerase sigma factor [Casimicrobiaceae bacterium]|nr:sigma-70 family RNA polymerase sigma factor [Casimicrobiaceae bacterium]
MATSPDKSARLADLLARTALADQAAFAELYRLTSGQLYGLALRMLRDHALAEEILQDVYVSVWHHAATYAASKSQPATWLTSIARNRCLDQLRKRELETVPITRDDDNDGEVEMEFAADDPTPMEMLLNGAESRSVRECVDTLEGGQKQAIALAFYQGLTHAELAQQLRQPLGTIKSWVRRGLERLRQCLDRSGYVH